MLPNSKCLSPGSFLPYLPSYSGKEGTTERFLIVGCCRVNSEPSLWECNHAVTRARGHLGTLEGRPQNVPSDYDSKSSLLEGTLDVPGYAAPCI
jgi:hypothetical protein